MRTQKTIFTASKAFRPHAFTLVEMLVVVAIIMILIGLVAYAAKPDPTKIKISQSHLVVIQKAIYNYYQLYHRWPIPDDKNILTKEMAMAEGLPETWVGCYKAKNHEIIRQLKTAYEKEAVLEVNDVSLDGAGDYADPWGSAYVIQIMDSELWDEAAKVVSSGGGTNAQKYWIQQIKEKVNVYGFGPNKTDEFGYQPKDGDLDNDGKVDPIPPPFFAANPGKSVDDLMNAKKIDDIRGR